MEDATATLASEELADPERVEALRRACSVVRLLAEGLVETSVGGSDPKQSAGSVGAGEDGRVSLARLESDAPSAGDFAVTEVLRP